MVGGTDHADAHLIFLIVVLQVASELGRLLRPLKGMCHVNIIPLNPTAGYKGGPSMADAVNQFVDVLARNGVPATPR